MGDETRLYPHVVLYPGVTVGARCHVHAGAVIGSPGFGYEMGAEGPIGFPQNGTVILGDEVRIGANTTIWELHGQLRWRGLQSRVLYVGTDIEDVAEINAAQGFVGDESVGEEQLTAIDDGVMDGRHDAAGDTAEDHQAKSFGG